MNHLRVLFAAARLDAARDVDAPRLHALDRRPRRWPRRARPRGSARVRDASARACVPVGACGRCRCFGPSNSRRGGGDRRRAAVAVDRQGGAARSAARAQRDPRRRSAANPARTRRALACTSSRGGWRNTATRLTRRRHVRRELQRALGRDLARRFREHEAERVGAGLERGRGGRLAVDAADLHEHAGGAGMRARRTVRARSSCGLPRRAPGCDQRGECRGRVGRAHQRRADEREPVAKPRDGARRRRSSRCRSRRPSASASADTARARRSARSARRDRAGRGSSRPRESARDRRRAARRRTARAARGPRGRTPRAARTGRSSRAQSTSARTVASSSIVTITRTPPAPAARASSTWYGSVTKSLRIAGIVCGLQLLGRVGEMRELALELGRLGQHRHRARAAARVRRELRVPDRSRVSASPPAAGERQLELRDHVEAVELKTRRRRGVRARAARELRVALGRARDSYALAARGCHPLEERHAACSRPNATTRAMSSRPAPLASASRARATPACASST